MKKVLRAAELSVVSVLWLLLVLGVSVQVLLAPVFTSVLERELGTGATTGLGQERASGVANQVRAFVASTSEGSLPAQVAGRPAFDEAAVSHLKDVRAVISGSRTVSGVAAALLVAWVAFSLAAGRFDELRRGLKVSGIAVIAFIVLAAVVGVTGFDLLFEQFHGLFFAAGTWTFPEDSLLIQLFPEPFWMTAAASWAVLTALGGATLLAAGSALSAKGATGDSQSTRVV